MRTKALLLLMYQSESTETMIFGEQARTARQLLKALGLSLALLAAPQAVSAATPAASAPAAVEAAPATEAGEAAAPAAGSYERMKPTEGKGMPIPGAIGLQKQYSPLGNYGRWIHNVVLMPIIVFITLFVLGLLLIVIVAFRKRRNPVPSKTTHNTFIEVVWTLVPVLILVGIAVPSIDLLAKQFKPASKETLTIKATGNQWYWTYSYPDNGEFEVISNMLNLPDAPLVNNGVREVGSDPSDGPGFLEVDNRLVVPVGEPIRFQITASDVIHAFAVPSLWFKLDAVPGRINEKVVQIDEPGVYYGQCSELCGSKHGYMPIAVEALPRDKFNAWVLTQDGGVIDHQEAAEAAPAADPAPAADAAEAPATPEA
jgi:cytochrome c oxidase subunit II